MDSSIKLLASRHKDAYRGVTVRVGPRMAKKSPVRNKQVGAFSAPARRVIDAGERLIGEMGVENASLVQIAVAAGLTGKSVVQYHFGSREGLIKAIFECRVPELNKIREQYLKKIPPVAELDLLSLIYILFVPAIDHTNERGEHIYAKFSSRIRFENFSIHEETAYEPYKRIRELLAHLTDWEFSLRFSMVRAMFDTAVWRIDEQGVAKKAAIFGSFLVMAERAFMAPLYPIDLPTLSEPEQTSNQFPFSGLVPLRP